MRITSWYLNVNGSHVGLPPNYIHGMTGLGQPGWQIRVNYDVFAQAHQRVLAVDKGIFSLNCSPPPSWMQSQPSRLPGFRWFLVCLHLTPASSGSFPKKLSKCSPDSRNSKRNGNIPCEATTWRHKISLSTVSLWKLQTAEIGKKKKKYRIARCYAFVGLTVMFGGK